MEKELTPQEEEMLDRAFGISPQRKKAKEEAAKKAAQPDPNSIEAQIKRVFG